MELEIGMYVRTLNGKIWVIKSQQAISGHKRDIINASYNIIDLIEVGDYINGAIVTQMYIDNIKYIAPEIKENNYGIKSIVTKEQFESIEYKVGE